MLKMLRISESESELIRKKSIEINKKLMDADQAPIKDSEMLHLLIEKCLPRLTVKNGQIEIMNILD